MIRILTLSILAVLVSTLLPAQCDTLAPLLSPQSDIALNYSPGTVPECLLPLPCLGAYVQTAQMRITTPGPKAVTFSGYIGEVNVVWTTPDCGIVLFKHCLPPGPSATVGINHPGPVQVWLTSQSSIAASINAELTTLAVYDAAFEQFCEVTGLEDPAPPTSAGWTPIDLVRGKVGTPQPEQPMGWSISPRGRKALKL
jgi:hypothetical protein